MLKLLKRLLLVSLLVAAPVANANWNYIDWVSVVSGGNDSYTVLLLNCDGADESTTFTDTSIGGSTHTVTAFGNAQVDTAIKKFGTGSLFPVRTSSSVGGSLIVPSSSDFNFGNSNFTIDFWVNYSNKSDSPYFAFQGDYNAGSIGWSWAITQHGTNNLRFLYTTDGTTMIQEPSGYDLPENEWVHVEVDRDSTNVYLFANGDLKHTYDIGTNTIYSSLKNVSFGAGNMESISEAWGTIDGRMDEIRISKGIARHTANFIPPTRPYIE